MRLNTLESNLEPSATKDWRGTSVETMATAMVLAAGRGERMRPLIDHTPKPMLMVRGKPLMQWHMEALAAAGQHDMLINTAWLGPQIESHFGLNPDLPEVGRVRLKYSHEGKDFGYALETAGGIVRALPYLAPVFWVLAGDIFAPDFKFTDDQKEAFQQSPQLAHIWLVPNPPHNPAGDFGLSEEGLALNLPRPASLFTFSTFALYKKEFFAPAITGMPLGNPQGKAAPLAPLLRSAMDRGQVSASIYTGSWTDVGTPERLHELNQTYTHHSNSITQKAISR
jgi:MurNAc alpha-1-phosphate uridylyltransferase